jgi:MtN3 and saliva related transmembrane protein
MDMIALTGYLAGTLTTISFVPQVLRTWKLRETKDFSLAMLLLFAAGMLLWTAYGILISSFPIIAANVITFGLILFLLGMKIRYQ